MSKTGRILILLGLMAAIAAVIVVRRNNSREPREVPAASSTGLPRLIGMGSTACTPCKMQTDILVDMKKSYAGRLDVEIVDVALYPSAAKRYGMNIFPSQIFLLPSGKETRHEGFFSRQEIVDKWRELGVNLTPPTSTGQP